MVFPCHPGTKEPILKAWQDEATDDPVQHMIWAEEYPDCNWALVAGRSNLAIIDIDGATGEDSLATFELEYGYLPETREHTTPRGGRHLIFAGEIVNTVGKLGPKLDTRGGNGYIVIPPSTFEGKPYVLSHDRAIASLPSVVAEHAGRRREAAKAAAGTQLDSPLSIARGRRLLEDYIERGNVARQGSGGDALTYAVCAEITNLGLSQDKAFELLEPWNAACVPPWDEEELRVKIENASAYSQNEAGAWSVPSVRERIGQEALDKLLADSEVVAQREQSRFGWMDEDEFTTMEPPAWLLKDIFTTNSIAMLFGPSGHFKSFIALNLAAEVAKLDQCAFYVAAEGISRMARKDYPAWKLAYGEDRKLPFYMVEDMPLASTPEDFHAFADSIRAKAAGRPIGLIVLDTLNNMAMGLEENSASDMAQVVSACKALKRTFGCTVLVIHHTSADGKELRGSTALYAGFDTVLKVIADKKIKLARMFVTKQKTDEERPYPFCYEGKRFGPGLAFVPLDAKEAAVLSDEANIFSNKSVSAALVELNAFLPTTVSSEVLLRKLVPQLENETEQARSTSLARAARGLAGVLKEGKLDGYYEGFGKAIKWSLPAPKT